MIKLGNHGHTIRLCEICNRPFKCYNISGRRIQNRCPSCQKEYERIYRKYKQVWGKIGTRDPTIDMSIIMDEEGKLRVKGSKLLEEYSKRKKDV